MRRSAASRRVRLPRPVWRAGPGALLMAVVAGFNVPLTGLVTVPVAQHRRGRDLESKSPTLPVLANAHVQLQGAFPSKFVNFALLYLTLAHNLMPVAPVCCNM